VSSQRGGEVLDAGGLDGACGLHDAGSDGPGLTGECRLDLRWQVVEDRAGRPCDGFLAAA
jgi:hypothetical protein